MTNKTFTDLPSVTNANMADIFCVVQSGISSKETLQQVFALMLANITLNYAGNPNGNVAGVIYQFCIDTTNNTLYICTSSGTTSTAVWKFIGSDVSPPVVDGDFVNFTGTSGKMKDSGYSPSDSTKSKVVMAGSAVQSGYIAHFTDTAGTIDDTAGTVINAGSIQAGLSGTPGSQISYPSTAAKGSLALTAVDNSGDYANKISNAATGQPVTWSFPDPGASTANILLSKSPSTQHVTSSGLQIDAGSLISGISTGGTQGTMQLFPSTAAKGSLSWKAVDNSGDTATIFETDSLGQATTYTYADPANANARPLIAATTTPFTNGNFPVASGTGGLMVDSGVAASNLQNKTNIKSALTGNIGGSGAGPIDVTVSGLTASSVVTATLASSTNPVEVRTTIAASNKFSVTFSGDPGASAILNYVAFIAPQ